MGSTKLILGRLILCHGDQLLHGGGILVRRGRIHSIVEGTAAAMRLARRSDAEILDGGPGLWSAGLVNAHAHLELTALAGAVPRLSFARWVPALVRARKALSREALVRGLHEGADRLLATGTTAVGDNDSLGLAVRVLKSHPLRARIFAESLDVWESKRTRSALRAARAPCRGTPTLAFGIGPHAPYTVSPSLGRGLARAARRRRVPLSIHFAESRAEIQWMERGSGPLASLLPPSPGLTPLDHLQQVGLVGRGTALIHCNQVKPEDRRRIAELGASVVHCPKSHEFFRRKAFDVHSWISAGVPLALGTDSSASNWDLDMRAEMAHLSESCPELDPATIWTFATEGGARSLGWSSRIGRLEAGYGADVVQWDLVPRSKAQALEALTSALPGVRRVLAAGQQSYFAE